MHDPDLWSADRRPLSVVVLGNSVASLVMPREGATEQEMRTAANYLAVLADHLTAAGVPVHPHLEAEWFGFLHRATRDFQRRVRNHNPDVLIVQFGLNEMQPWIVPVALIRHLLVLGWSATRTSRAYRKRVATPLWTRVRQFRRWASPHVGTRTWQTTPRRFAGHLEALIRMVRAQGRPLVLVLDVNEPGAVLEHFLPGMHERHAVFQRTIADVVRSFASDDVRMVPCARICAETGPVALPDGMHMSSAAHAAVGAALAAEIRAWLGTGR
ncbi:MAG TPA: hypothetical protein VF288_07210 [Mycobacteriales bacterium]